MRNLKSGPITARAKHALNAAAVAGLAGLALAPGLAHAAAETIATAAPGSSTDVDGVDVTGRNKLVSSPKYTAELRDTPQTITIISSDVIAAQNLLSLREILSTQPGITFGAGEGGGGYGDSINLRGYSANNDITVDGVRDSAQYTRSDPFNLDQVEVINGANSVYSGSGSVGGTINLVTKTPKAEDAIILGAGIGTDDYRRLTVDANKALTDTIAVRLNVMLHGNDVPGRDVEKYERWGVAPSITFGLGTPTRVIFSYVHQKDENVPQYGVPYFKNAFYNGALPGVDSSNYYGYANLDTQEITVDQLTMRIEHDFNDAMSIRNLTRYQEVTQFARVDPPQGTWCLGGGLTATGVSCSALANGFYQPSGPRGNTRDTKNTLLYTQTDFTARFNTGAVSHSFVAGFSLSSEDYHLDTSNILRNAGGATPNPTLPPMSIANPNNIYSGPLNSVTTARGDGELKNAAIYAFDTAKLSDQFELNLGMRYERVEGEFFSTTIAVPYPATGPVEVVGAPGRTQDNLFSYRVGLVYKPIEAASLYIAYGNTETPSQASVNGGCTLTSTTGTANCNVDPEKGMSIEIGGKLQAFDGRLLLTGAIFRNERSNYKVASADPTLPDQVLDGKARVDGVSLGVSGKITDKWSIFANYTYLDSEVLQSVANGVALDPQKGNPLTNTPKHSGSLWTTYELPHGFSLGYGVTYQGAAYLNNGVGPLYQSDSYWVHNAMVAWKATDKISLQLNVKNLTDEEYYIRIRNNGWAVPGDGRSAVLSVNYQF